MTMPTSPGTRHSVKLVARVWKDYQIPGNGFHTTTTFSHYSGWRCEIGKPEHGKWLSSEWHKTEGAAQSQVVGFANKEWPL